MPAQNLPRKPWWCAFVVVAAALKIAAASITSPKGPTAVMEGVQLLYNNDGENILAVNSSYHRPYPWVDSAAIRGSAADVAGIADVGMICPFHNVPWWQSKLEPPSQHRDWYDNLFNFTWGRGGSQLDFVLKGGDLLGEFVQECLDTVQKPFVSFRLNDGQMCELPPTSDNSSAPGNNDHQFDRLSQFWWEHKNNASLILGLQQTPPVGFRPCCWLRPRPKNCTCSTMGCEFSWCTGSVLSAAGTRISALVGELAHMYVARGVRGIELDFQRGLNYFADDVPVPTRRRIMRSFVRGVRNSLDAAAAAAGLGNATGVIALGLRLTPSWEQLRLQGIDELPVLLEPVESGGCGVTYLTFGVNFLAFQPFDSDLASLTSALPPGTAFYFEVTSWTGYGPLTKSCGPEHGAFVRLTREELWTTALLARSYGARGLSAFNFVYTRGGIHQSSCQDPPAEPLFGDLNLTKNATFLGCADQLYRLSSSTSRYDHLSGQLPLHGLELAVGLPSQPLRIVAVRPTGGWSKRGRLRLLGDRSLNSSGVSSLDLTAALNGVSLVRTANASSQFDEGVQAALSAWPAGMWLAFEVPPHLMTPGNNSLTLTAHGRVPDPGERSYMLVHTGNVTGGDGERWRFPHGHQPGSTVNGTAHAAPLDGFSLADCESLCDEDELCEGVYYEPGWICFALHELIVDRTALTGVSYRRIKHHRQHHRQHRRRGQRGQADGRVAGAMPTGYTLKRIELSLPAGCHAAPG